MCRTANVAYTQCRRKIMNSREASRPLMGRFYAWIPQRAFFAVRKKKRKKTDCATTLAHEISYQNATRRGASSGRIKYLLFVFPTPRVTRRNINKTRSCLLAIKTLKLSSDKELSVGRTTIRILTNLWNGWYRSWNGPTNAKERIEVTRLALLLIILSTKIYKNF